MSMNDKDKIKTLKEAIDKMLRGINFALDENYTRRAVSARLKECRAEAIKILTESIKKN